VRRTLVSLCWALAMLVAACSSPSRLTRPDPEARTVADAFARAWIEDGLDGVKPYLSSRIAEDSIERDHDFFVAHKFVTIGRAQFDDQVGWLSSPGYVVAALGLEGQRNVDEAYLIHWTIGIVLVREDESWKVAGYEYTAGPPVESVDDSRR
jgi:hypothetical protein